MKPHVVYIKEIHESRNLHLMIVNICFTLKFNPLDQNQLTLGTIHFCVNRTFVTPKGLIQPYEIELRGRGGGGRSTERLSSTAGIELGTLSLLS